MQKVEVVWLDAATEEAHIPLEEALKLTPIERSNVGYLLVEDNDRILLAYGILNNMFKGLTAYDYSMEIPKGMIVKIKKLK